LRDFGQYTQLHPPSDATNTAVWMSTLPTTANASYPISNIQVVCGDAKLSCSSSNSNPPMYYSYTTTVSLAPISPIVQTVLCSNANPCSFTLPYSERFQ
jgi:hypothetical protein